MKGLYSFNFRAGQIAELNKMIPATIRSRIIRKFIKTEYNAPVNLDKLKGNIKDGEGFLLALDPAALTKIENIQKQLKHQFDEKVSKSAIMRDVLDLILEKYKEPLPEPQRKSIPFNVPKGLVKKLDEYISSKERSAVVSEFILEEYSITGVKASELKKKVPEGLELKMFHLEEAAIERLDELAEKLDSKRTYIFRDVLNKLLDNFENSDDRKIKLQKEFISVVDQLSDYMAPGEMKELITQYEENKKEGKPMMYEQIEEMLVVPQNQQEVEYVVNSKRDKN